MCVVIHHFFTLTFPSFVAILTDKGRDKPMLRKFFSLLILLQSIGMLCWYTPISAHDAFYPHHREDFENMARRRELRTTVLLCTAAFLFVLTAVVYAALRNSKDDDDIDKRDVQTVQKRLTDATNRAANAALRALDANGNIAEAVTICLTTYAEACGVTWRPRPYTNNREASVPYQIRCKIAADIITLSIDAEVIQLKAERDLSKIGFSRQKLSKSAIATAALRRSGKENGEDVAG